MFLLKIFIILLSVLTQSIGFFPIAVSAAKTSPLAPNSKVLYMSLCYTPSDILFYVKGNSGFEYPDDKHAIALDDVHAIANNLKNLSKAIGSGIKNKMKIKIK